MKPSCQRSHGYMQGVGHLRMHFRSWEVDAPAAAVLVLHGLFEHSGRFDELASTLAGHRCSTFALDMRGHGASEGRRGHVRRFDVLLQDVDRFRREVQGLVPVDLPFFLLGNSWGGLIALRYLQEYDTPFRGAVLTSPWLGTTASEPGWKVFIGRLLDRVLPAFPVPVRLDADELTHDERRAADYRDDPTIHSTITPRLFSETEAAMERALARGDRIDVPLLFLLAGDDRIVDTERSRAFARSLPNATVEVYEGLFHDVLQERDRDLVMAEVAGWISARLG